MAFYPCTDDPREIMDAVAGARLNAEKFDRFVNGGVAEEVQLGEGQPTPTIRNTVHLVKSAAAELDGSDVSGKFSDAANGGEELRMLADRFGDIVNVKDFGAVGDGIVDDAAAFQAAAQTGRSVFVPQGAYYLSEPVSGDFWSDGAVHLTGQLIPIHSLTQTADAVKRLPLSAVCRPSTFAFQLVQADGTTDWATGSTQENLAFDPVTNELYVKIITVENSEEKGYVQRFEWDDEYKAYKLVSTSADATSSLGHQGFGIYRPSVSDSPVLVSAISPHLLTFASWSGMDGSSVSTIKSFTVLDSTMVSDSDAGKRDWDGDGDLDDDGDTIYTGLMPAVSADGKKVACRMVRASDKKIVFRVWDIAKLLESDETDQSSTYELSVVEPDWDVWKTNVQHDITRQCIAFDGSYFYCLDSHTGYTKHFIKAFDIYGNAACERPGTMEGILQSPTWRSFEGESLFWGRNRCGVNTLMLSVSVANGTAGDMTYKRNYAYDLLSRSSDSFPLEIHDWIDPCVWVEKTARFYGDNAVRDSINAKDEGIILRKINTTDSYLSMAYKVYGVNNGGIGFTSNYVDYTSTNDTVVTSSKDETYKASVRLYANSSYKAFAPGVGLSGLVALGSPSVYWGNYYGGEQAASESDERVKDNIEEPSEAVLRAWGRVRFKVFQKKKAIEEKGENAARIHAGVIAQEVQVAFGAEGLDAFRFGLIGYDAWEDKYEEDERGSVVKVRSAGSRYSIRYGEALCLEAAFQRRRVAQAEARISALEERLARLEARIGE